MKDVMKKVLDNPWGSAFLIGAVVNGVVKIVRAFRGDPVTPAGITVTRETPK